MQNPKKLISLELSEDLISKLKELAAGQELSMSALIRTALLSYVKDYEKRNESR